MTRPSLSFAVLPALLLSACAANPVARRLTYAEVQAINPGVRAQWLEDEYPFGRVLARWPDGTPRQTSYLVTDPAGHGQTLTLDFDPSGTLVARRYSGPVLRPPPDQK